MSWIRCQSCLASIASLNLYKSLKPNPPSIFGWHKLDSTFLPMNLSSFTPLAPPKFLNECLNILTKTYRQSETTHSKSRNSLNHDLQQHLLTGLWKEFFLHPCTFPQTLSFMSFRLAFFLLRTTAGNPKYFSFSLISRTPRRFFNSSSVISNTFLLKKKGGLI